MRVVAMVFIPFLILCGIELALRLAGYGYDTSFFRRIKIDGRDYYVPNETFSYRFFPPAIARKTLPFRFAEKKAANSYRIFLFGGSAAMGDPDPTYGVGRYLEVLLRERYPGTDFQVICTALTAIDSSTVLPIARECARHQGDMWLIYMGNNEMVGPFGAETSFGFRAPSSDMIRIILAIKSTRIGQLLDALTRRLNSSTPKKWAGMEMFVNNRLGYDDPARLRTYDNFRRNLEAILRAANKAGVPVILSTVAVNLKDCAPFASVHSPGLDKEQMSLWNQIYQKGINLEKTGSYRQSLDIYQKAAAIDPQFADLQFRMGMCNLALTNRDQARRDFELARDYDALDFRADTRINSIIRKAAAVHAGRGVYLLDAANALAQSSPDGIPGFNFFYEHVHLNFAGNYLLAIQFAEQIKKLLPDSITSQDQGRWASATRCDRRLAITGRDRLGVWLRIWSSVTAPPFTGQFNHAASLKFYEAKLAGVRSMMKAQTPQQAMQIYQKALALAPSDIFLRLNFVAFLEAEGYLAQAITEAKHCCELLPQIPGLYYTTATLLIRAGRSAEAAAYLSPAIALRGNYVEALDEMGEILANQQKTVQATYWFKRAIRANPNYVESYLDLGFLQEGQGQADAAMANYQKAASLQPNGPADYFTQANTAAAMYQWDEVIAYLRAAVKAKPEFWQAHYQLGIQLAAKEEIQEAQKQFIEAIHYRPDFAPAHLELGINLAAQEQTNQALAEFHVVLQLDPENSSARQEIETIETKLRNGH
jgi:tetratricopeptide (TPR) repeat protein